MAVLHSGIVPYKYKFQASAGTNDLIIKKSPGFLHSITIGAWISGGSIGMSDHASDGAGNRILDLDPGSNQSFIIDAWCETGITAEQWTQTNVTYTYF